MEDNMATYTYNGTNAVKYAASWYNSINSNSYPVTVAILVVVETVQTLFHSAYSPVEYP